MSTRHSHVVFTHTTSALSLVIHNFGTLWHDADDSSHEDNASQFKFSYKIINLACEKLQY